MNAETKVKADKPNPHMKIWDALAKTDPAQTKAFNRAGGFKGTAIKPIWVIKRLTEMFGPCGVGWGIGEPQFQVVDAGEEILVYCTVSCWHNNGVANANPVASLCGVGGDKVKAKRSGGAFCDDEAFKKAFTDAVNNAFKFVGVAADIHMGQFDDNKYVAAMREEFAEPKVAEISAKDQEGDLSPSALKGALRTVVHNINGCSDLGELIAYLDIPEAKQALEQCERRAPAWWSTGEGMPPEFKPLELVIADKKRELTEMEDINKFRTPVDAG